MPNTTLKAGSESSQSTASFKVALHIFKISRCTLYYMAKGSSNITTQRKSHMNPMKWRDWHNRLHGISAASVTTQTMKCRIETSPVQCLKHWGREREIHYVHSASLAYEAGIVFMSEPSAARQ